MKNIQSIVNNSNGKLKGYQLTNWNVNFKTGEGVTVSFVFDTEYEKTDGTESIKMLKPTGKKDYQIIYHHFNSDLIQAAIDKGTAMAAKQVADEATAQEENSTEESGQNSQTEK